MLKAKFGKAALLVVLLCAIIIAGLLLIKLMQSEPANTGNTTVLNKPENVSVNPGIVRGTYSLGANVQWKEIPDAVFSEPKAENGGIDTFTVDASRTYQEYQGMGISLDETSISNIWKIQSQDQREALIKKLVDPKDGAGFNLFRITIGSPDCIEHLPFWSYDELPEGVTEDWDLKYFSIEKDKKFHIIDTIKLIQKYNPNAVFYASAWSAPAWMKTENKFTGVVGPVPGNSSAFYQKNKLRDDCINVFARYYVKFLQAYEAEGINIRAITMLNEPGIDVVYPAMDISIEQQKKLAKEIKSEFSKAGLKTELWAHDFNWWDWKYSDPNTKNYHRIFEDADTLSAIDALAFHTYWGEPSTMALASLEYNKPVHITETNTFVPGTIVSWFNNYMSSYAGWCTITDQNGGTLHWTNERNNDIDWTTVNPSWKDRLIVVNTSEQLASFTFGFYGLGQFSKYLTNGTQDREGAVRINSETALRGFSGVAFKNPDGEIVLVLINNVGEKTIRLVMDGSEAVVKVPQGTVTLRWYPVNGQ